LSVFAAVTAFCYFEKYVASEINLNYSALTVVMFSLW